MHGNDVTAGNADDGPMTTAGTSTPSATGAADDGADFEDGADCERAAAEENAAADQDSSADDAGGRAGCYQNDDLDAYRAISMDLDAAYARIPKACGLSEPEYWSLVLISEGCDTQRDICERIACSKQTLNSAFKLLIRKGLIRLIPVETDQRTKQAALTDKGRDFRRTHIDTLYMAEDRAWQRLTPAEQAKLARLTQKFTQALCAELADHQRG